MKLKKKSISGIVLVAFAAVILAISVMPRYKYSFSYIQLFAISIPFLFLFVLRFWLGIKKTQWIFTFLALIAVFRFLVNTFLNPSAALNTSLILYLCIVGYLIFEALNIRNNQSEILSVIVILSLMFVYIAVNTFREFSENPMVARILAYGASDDEYLNLLRFNNIGGFGFSYAMGMLNPYFALLVVRTKGANKVVSVILLVANLSFCILTQYTTLALLSVFFVIYVFSTKIRNSGLKLVSLIVSGIVLANLRNIIVNIASNIQLETLANHLWDMAAMISGEGSSSGRSSLYGNALTLFFQNPLFGADLTDSNTLYIVNHSHSTFFGILASGGILGTMLYYGVFFGVMGNIKKTLPNFRDIEPVYLMFLVLSVLNPVTHFEITIVVFLLIPLIELYWKNHTRNEVKEDITYV